MSVLETVDVVKSEIRKILQIVREEDRIKRSVSVAPGCFTGTTETIVTLTGKLNRLQLNTLLSVNRCIQRRTQQIEPGMDYLANSFIEYLPPLVDRLLLLLDTLPSRRWDKESRGIAEFLYSRNFVDTLLWLELFNIAPARRNPLIKKILKTDQDDLIYNIKIPEDIAKQGGQRLYRYRVAKNKYKILFGMSPCLRDKSVWETREILNNKHRMGQLVYLSNLLHAGNYFYNCQLRFPDNRPIYDLYSRTDALPAAPYRSQLYNIYQKSWEYLTDFLEAESDKTSFELESIQLREDYPADALIIWRLKEAAQAEKESELHYTKTTELFGNTFHCGLMANLLNSVLSIAGKPSGSMVNTLNNIFYKKLDAKGKRCGTNISMYHFLAANDLYKKADKIKEIKLNKTGTATVTYTTDCEEKFHFTGLEDISFENISLSSFLPLLTASPFLIDKLIVQLPHCALLPTEDAAYTDGTAIFLPEIIGDFADYCEPQYSRNMSCYYALLFHEMSHLLHGSFLIDFTGFVEKQSEPGLLHELFNAIEDFRIEQVVPESALPVYAEQLLHQYNNHITNMIIDHFHEESINVSKTRLAILYLSVFAFDLEGKNVLRKITHRFFTARELRTLARFLNKMKTLHKTHPIHSMKLAYQIYRWMLQQLKEEDSKEKKEAGQGENGADEQHKHCENRPGAEESNQSAAESNRLSWKKTDKNDDDTSIGKPSTAQSKPDRRVNNEEEFNRMIKDFENQENNSANNLLEPLPKKTPESAPAEKRSSNTRNRPAEKNTKKGGFRRVLEWLRNRGKGKSNRNRNRNKPVRKKARTKPNVSQKQMKQGESPDIVEFDFERLQSGHYIKLPKQNVILQRRSKTDQEFMSCASPVMREAAKLRESMLKLAPPRWQQAITPQSRGEQFDISELITILSEKNLRNDFLLPDIKSAKHLELPEIVVGIDCSGSTYNPLRESLHPGLDTVLDMEKAAALLLCEALKPISRSLTVYGFNSDDKTTVMQCCSYQNLSSLQAGSANHDGTFLHYIRTRHCHGKPVIFFYISDGYPSADQYEGAPAVSDTAWEMKQFSRRNSKLIYLNFMDQENEWMPVFQKAAWFAEQCYTPEKLLEATEKIVTQLWKELFVKI